MIINMKVYLNSSLDGLSKTKSDTYFFWIDVDNNDWQELMNLPHWNIERIKNKVADIIATYTDRELFEDDDWINSI